jgi:hypothetical protein
LKPRPAALGAARESEEKALTSAIVCVQSARSPATDAAFTRDADAIPCYLSDRKGGLWSEEEKTRASRIRDETVPSFSRA